MAYAPGNRSHFAHTIREFRSASFRPLSITPDRNQIRHRVVKGSIIHITAEKQRVEAFEGSSGVLLDSGEGTGESITIDREAHVLQRTQVKSRCNVLLNALEPSMVTDR